MCMSLVVAIALTAFGPENPSTGSPSAEAIRAYETAKVTVGRDAESHVKLALWCEAHGLRAEKFKHLALAVLLNPSHATARGLLGLVADRGRWLRPDAVSDRVMHDEEVGRLLAQYNAKRAALKNQSASAHWKLALWCAEKGLKAEATAHFTTVTRLDPSRDEAWKRLGCRKHNGRWMTDAQIAEEKADAEIWKNADAQWKPRLLKLRTDLGAGDKARRALAEKALAQINDALAVPSVWAVFVASGKNRHMEAAQILRQIPEAGASRALAALAVFDRSPEVRRLATETLRQRDSRDFVTLLIGFLRDPIHYYARPTRGPGDPGELFVQGQATNVHRVYEFPVDFGGALNGLPPRLFASSIPFNPFSPQNFQLAFYPTMANPVLPPQFANAVANHPQQAPALLSHHPGGHSHGSPSAAAVLVNNATALAAQRDMMLAISVQEVTQRALAVSQAQLNNDIQTVEALRARVAQVNQWTLNVLGEVTNQDFGEEPELWRKWWTDQQGYVYAAPPSSLFKPTYTELVENPVLVPPQPHRSCFGAGTPVRTLAGLRPIEELQTGDQVLTQDTKTGRLSFEPILAIFHNSPAATLRIKLEGGTIVATGIHRFWRAGKGWVMARELKPGDRVRTIDGTSRVEEIEKEVVQPVFNLEVASHASFFVGPQGALVHDNTLVEPVFQPFDASGEIAATATAANDVTQ